MAFVEREREKESKRDVQSNRNNKKKKYNKSYTIIPSKNFYRYLLLINIFFFNNRRLGSWTKLLDKKKKEKIPITDLTNYRLVFKLR